MKAIYKLSLLLTLSLLCACADIKVTSDYDKSVNFSHYKTFAFHQLVDKSGTVSELNKRRILTAIKADLLKKGLSETENNPDVLVNATTILQDKQRLTASTDYYGVGGVYRPYGWGRFGGMNNAVTTVNVQDYTDGSLIIDIIDANKQELVWQGTGNKEIDQPASNPDQAINEAVTKIMQGFPPNATSK